MGSTSKATNIHTRQDIIFLKPASKCCRYKKFKAWLKCTTCWCGLNTNYLAGFLFNLWKTFFEMSNPYWFTTLDKIHEVCFLLQHQQFNFSCKSFFSSQLNQRKGRFTCENVWRYAEWTLSQSGLQIRSFFCCVFQCNNNTNYVLNH